MYYEIENLLSLYQMSRDERFNHNASFIARQVNDTRSHSLIKISHLTHFDSFV